MTHQLKCFVGHSVRERISELQDTPLTISAFQSCKIPP